MLFYIGILFPLLLLISQGQSTPCTPDFKLKWKREKHTGQWDKWMVWECQQNAKPINSYLKNERKSVFRGWGRLSFKRGKKVWWRRWGECKFDMFVSFYVVRTCAELTNVVSFYISACKTSTCTGRTLRRGKSTPVKAAQSTTAGETLCPSWCRLLPEKVNMLLFLLCQMFQTLTLLFLQVPVGLQKLLLCLFNKGQLQSLNVKIFRQQIQCYCIGKWTDKYRYG